MPVFVSNFPYPLYSSIEAKGKLLYSADIPGSDEHHFLISEIAVSDNKVYLRIPGNYYLIPLFPGKTHIIQFYEASKQGGSLFEQEFREVRFLYPQKDYNQ